MNDVILSTNNITKYYQVGDTTIKALDGVSIEIKKGEFVAIVGKSGSGKSTLMHLIGLLDSPTSGEIVLNGINTTQMTEAQLAKVRNEQIGFVFQAFNLLTRTSSLENVMLPLRYSTVPQAQWEPKSTQMLQMVGLGDRLSNKSNELSGGQKQRVAIARALVTEPAMILADEPTGNLDSKTGAEIENLFIELNKQGKTVVIVTHDDDLARIAKRRILLSDGRVVA